MELSIEKLGVNYHYNAISRGVIDTRDLLYFISVSSFSFLPVPYQLKAENGDEK